jgi:hypothetical protein
MKFFLVVDCCFLAGFTEKLIIVGLIPGSNPTSKELEVAK